jgi:hypothetical protein
MASARSSPRKHAQAIPAGSLAHVPAALGGHRGHY